MSRTPPPLPTRPYSNAHLPAPERFGHWAELLDHTHAPMDLRSDHADDFLVRQRAIVLGESMVWPAAFPPVTFLRTDRLIRQSDPESYHLTLTLRGGGVADWRHRTLRAGPGTLHTNDSSRPVEIRTATEPGRRILMIGVEVPKTSLPLPRRIADRAIGLPIPDDHGTGALLAHFLRQLVRTHTEYRLTDGPRLGAVLTDLTAAALAHALEENRALPAHTRRNTTVLRIRAFIQQHLDDPALSPPLIAAAHHISTSYLHRLFRQEGVTVAALIRRQRLERARAELADPHRAGRPVHAIAARWCMTATDFSRSFRAAYGMPPGEYRRLQQRPTPPPDRS
ncbi:helix-turn-helix domain-containing protein [Streptomyces sp. LE64]|uniref:helix-turn-helix domain-containing protein n=1 Tax=Streptomyces sp. LE64 TaxID=3448653 RepID=UPI004041AC4A